MAVALLQPAAGAGAGRLQAAVEEVVQLQPAAGGAAGLAQPAAEAVVQLLEEGAASSGLLLHTHKVGHIGTGHIKSDQKHTKRLARTALRCAVCGSRFTWWRRSAHKTSL